MRLKIAKNAHAGIHAELSHEGWRIEAFGGIVQLQLDSCSSKAGLTLPVNDRDNFLRPAHSSLLYQDKAPKTPRLVSQGMRNLL